MKKNVSLVSGCMSFCSITMWRRPAIVTNKLQMYQRYKDYVKKRSTGKLTLGEFHNEIIKQPNIDCKTVKGEEYYTNCLYEPTHPRDDDFYI